jgi:hypothetical protein
MHRVLLGSSVMPMKMCIKSTKSQSTIVTDSGVHVACADTWRVAVRREATLQVPSRSRRSIADSTPICVPSHAQPVSGCTSVILWVSCGDYHCCLRSCKPIAGGHINVTDQHTLIGTYSGQDRAMVDAVADVTAGGWRNDVSTLFPIPLWSFKLCTAHAAPR